MWIVRLALRRPYTFVVAAILALSRLTHLREIVSLPDLAGVRRALMDVIVRIEIGRDGHQFMLVGDGPLEPLPSGLDDHDARLLTSGAAQANDTRALPSGSRDVPGAEPCGIRPRSRLCMVGATGFEPATSWSRTKRATKLRYAPARSREEDTGDRADRNRRRARTGRSGPFAR
jgi:hypothetical protein